MTVKQFLHMYNFGRSCVKKVTVVDVYADGEAYTYGKLELINDAYGSRWGNLKINTFTITENKIVIYARPQA